MWYNHINKLGGDISKLTHYSYRILWGSILAITNFNLVFAVSFTDQCTGDKTNQILGAYLSSCIMPFARVLAVAAALLMITWSGFLYLTAGSNPENVNTAKEYLIGAISGLVLLFLIGLFLNILI